MPDGLLDRIDGANQAVYTETARRSGGTVDTTDGFVCVVGVHPSPIIANVAFRPPSTHPVGSHSVGPILGRILDRYRSIGHRVSLLSADHRDEDIVDAVSSGGWRSAIELPGMLLRARPARPDVRPGVSLSWVDPDRQLSTFRGVLQDGFADEEDERQMIGAVFARPASLAPPGIRAIIASVNGTPASCGVAYESEGLGVIGWVATLPAFRRQGLGTLVTAEAANALFDSGVTGVTLQASPDGLPVYTPMGFREVTRYTIWLPPEDPNA
jgi:ribosomal protein S18 acetylase RimI-like enzyme